MYTLYSKMYIKRLLKNFITNVRANVWEFLESKINMLGRAKCLDLLSQSTSSTFQGETKTQNGNNNKKKKKIINFDPFYL